MESVGMAAGAHPNLNLTPEEKRVYGQLFQEADPDGFGAVSGDVAVSFFERTRLPADVLGQIWQIADTENRGFLTPAGFGVVLRLIGHAQAGRAPTASLAPSPAPLPRFDPKPGQQPSQSQASLPAQIQAPLQAQSTGPPSSPIQSSPAPVRVPALTADKVAEYSSLFEKSGVENGQLSGFTAKQIFERARLPNEVLGRIWSLADSQGKGSLNMTEFVVAMHLLASYKTGAMRGVPTVLPAGLLEAATRRQSARAGSIPGPTPSALGQSTPILPQQFAQSQFNQRPQSPVTRAQLGTPLSAQSTGEPWLITPADKQKFDQVFNDQDRAGQGFITGEQAVQFFGNARLPEEVLASIWDLADINSDGVLNRDEFAVAMYLIRQQRGSTREGRGNIPSTLPAALVPPSMRRQQQPPAHTTAPAFEDAPVTKPRSAADDLFGIDIAEPAKQQQAPPQVAQSTGGADLGPFSNAAQPTQPFPTSTAAAAAAAAAPPPSTSTFQPFKPSSSFGMGLVPQSTGAQTQTRAPPRAEDNLLDDSDPVVNSRLNNDSAELGNLSNQIGSLSTQMTGLQQERGQHEQQISQTATQKQAFQERLAQLRTAYEQEAAQVRSLKEQLTTSQNETKRMQQDMAMLEGGHADLQTQRQQLVQSLQADQQENARLKEQMRVMNVETEQLKPQIEKLKSDARQQKGLVAINKKQLATNELERDRVKSELAAAQKEYEESVREAEESARQAEAAQRELEHARAQPKPTPIPKPAPSQAPVSRELPVESSTARNAPVASPNAFTSSNPFFRQQESGAVFSPPIGSRVTSPEPQAMHHDFDSIFGPPATAASTAPPTSFGYNTAAETTRDMPSRSSTPRVAEPPPAAPENQLTSSVLPLRNQLVREDSISSSTKVAPPASRIDPIASPRAFTPDTSTASPSSVRADDPFAHSAADEEQESVRRALPASSQSNTFTSMPLGHQTDRSFAPSAADEEQESVRQSLPRNETQDKLSKVDSLPGAFPTESSRTVTPAQNPNPTAIALGAGAATLAAGAGLAAVATSNVRGSTDQPQSQQPKDDFDDFFGGISHKKTPSEQARDFDSAFASMSTNTNGASRNAAPEFPEIKELDDNESDESSDDDEEEPRGFNNNFGNSNKSTKPAEQPIQASNKVPEIAALSAGGFGLGAATAGVAAHEYETSQQTRDAIVSGKQVENISAVPDRLQAASRPPFDSASTSSTLPDITQQTSPPTYNDVVPTDNPNHFPQEYKNLLPEREDPTSPAAGGSSNAQSNPSGSAAPPSYGPEIGHATRDVPASAITAPPPTKAAPFDFDSAFEGVGHAPVADDSDSDYDEDDTPVRGTEHPTGFDPTFASPAPSTRTTNTATTQPSMLQNTSIYADVTGPPTNINTTTDPTATNGYSYTTYSTANTVPRSTFSFDDYTSNSNMSSSTSPTQVRQQTQDYTPSNAPPPVTAGVSHDWDALFAPLNASSQPAAANTAAAEATQIAPGQTAITVASPIDRDSGGSTPLNPISTQFPSRTAAFSTTSMAPSTNIVPATPEAPRQTSTSTTSYQPPLGPPPSSQTLQAVTGSSSNNNIKPERPQPGRALSEGTEHDDPILKRLTAMGFSRSDSLAALEKFDYNIDKAADYLTFKT